MGLETILIIVLILVLLGGGGYWYSSRPLPNGAVGPGTFVNVLFLVVVAVLIVYLVRNVAL